MKALRLVKHGNSDTAFELQEAPKPTPGENEVLIKTQGFGLNFADVMARRGLYQDAPPLPSILGYEVVGIIESLGPLSKTFPPHGLAVGDRVVSMTRFGGYAEYAVANGVTCAKISKEANIAEACALATQFCTAYYAAEKKVQMGEGDVVLIHAAAGGVGTALIQLAKRRKCTIIATVGSDAKFDLAKQLGAHHVINYRAKDFKVEIEKLFGKESVDVIFDSLGGETFKKGYQLLRPTGVIVGFGAAENAKAGLKIVNGLKLLNGFGIFSPAFLIMKSKGIIGVNMLRVADHKPIDMKRTMDAVVELYDRGELKPVNGGIFPLSKIAEAHDLLESRKSTGKIAIQWDA